MSGPFKIAGDIGMHVEEHDGRHELVAVIKIPQGTPHLEVVNALVPFLKSDFLRHGHATARANGCDGFWLTLDDQRTSATEPSDRAMRDAMVAAGLGDPTHCDRDA